MSSQPSNTETALQKERKLFRELLDRLINVSLNQLFDLRPERAQRRSRNLTILFLVCGTILTLIYYRPEVWSAYIQDVFQYLLIPQYAASFTDTNPLTNFIRLLLQALLDARVLQYLPIFVAPFYIAQQLAAFYLADIFELEDITVARQFINEVAFTGSDETIRISQGKISESHRESPNYVIGGPGKVIVDLDSAALFERADGTPHVIGPTGKEPRGKATIEGFERFRFALDIREHHVELRDQDDKSPSVKSRSIDGIPVTATDVRLMFSIHRGNAQATADFPYPFSPDAIERIVYRSSSRVTPDQKEPSAHQMNWINNMIGLVRGKLGGFMSQRRLTEYLASIGTPEFEKALQRELLIAEQVQKLTEPDKETEVKPPKAPPSFTPRYEITKLFSDAFKQPAQDSGVELHWIGVGTWRIPLEIDVVSDNHIKAWEISQENMKAGSPEAMNRVEAEATLQKMESLIQTVPLGTYEEIVGPRKSFGNKRNPPKKHNKDWAYWGNQSADIDMNMFAEEDLIELREASKRGSKFFNRVLTEKIEALDQGHSESDIEHRENMRTFLRDYRKLLVEAKQIISNKNEPVPPSIEEAIRYINVQMGWKHWAGSAVSETDSKPTVDHGN